MAAKGIKETNRFNIAKYFSDIPEGKTLISIGILDNLKADAKRIEVINWDTMFDKLIETLLLFRFSRQDKTVNGLFDPNARGPLVSLTQKAKLAYALGLIDKIARNDFEYMHRIRNIFAHSVKASFADTEVVKFVRKLSTAKDQKITAKNSYKFYEKAVGKCVAVYNKISKQEIHRLAMLLSAKKDTKKLPKTTMKRGKLVKRKKQK